MKAPSVRTMLSTTPPVTPHTTPVQPVEHRFVVSPSVSHIQSGAALETQVAATKAQRA